MEEACHNFITENYVILSSQRNNFLCHLCTMYDAGILTAQQVATLMQVLQETQGRPNDVDRYTPARVSELVI